MCFQSADAVLLFYTKNVSQMNGRLSCLQEGCPPCRKQVGLIPLSALYTLCGVRHRDHDHKLEPSFVCVDVHRAAIFIHRDLDTAHAEAVEATVAFRRGGNAVHDFQLG